MREVREEMKGKSRKKETEGDEERKVKEKKKFKRQSS